MTTYVGSTEAARILGVTKPTLYAYVSRGIVAKRTAVDGRTSLYARDDLDRLAARTRRSRPLERPSIDVQIGSAITELHDDGVAYRGHEVTDLVAGARFEDVAELLWNGELPSTPARWSVDRAALQRCRSVVAVAAPDDPLVALTLAATTLAGLPDPMSVETGADAARRLLAIAPTILGGPQRGDLATRLARTWTERPSEELVDAISRSLILLADHELATSTLGVRVACSVRTDAASALATGLHIVRGPLHGAASVTAAALLEVAERDGAATAIGRILDVGRRLPGFGHTVYRNGDPRFAPLLDAVRRLPDGGERAAVVDAVLAEAGRALGQLPNVDLGLGALLYVADLPRNAPIFAIARIAGWGAHYDEERTERPVRYRGLTTRR